MGEGQLVVGAALVDQWPHPTRLLAARRAHGQLAGMWEFPGGKVEPGESPEEALRRELREELDIGIELGPEILGPDGAWPITNGWRMRVWFATTTDRVAARDVHDDVAWVGMDRLPQLRWLPADGPIVSAAVTYMRVESA